MRLGCDDTSYWYLLANSLNSPVVRNQRAKTDFASYLLSNESFHSQVMTDVFVPEHFYTNSSEDVLQPVDSVLPSCPAPAGLCVFRLWEWRWCGCTIVWYLISVVHLQTKLEVPDESHEGRKTDNHKEKKINKLLEHWHEARRRWDWQQQCVAADKKHSISRLPESWRRKLKSNPRPWGN